MRFLFVIIVILSTAIYGENPYVASPNAYKDFWEESIKNPEKFWDEQAKMIPWMAPYQTVWEKPESTNDAFVGKWFVKGKLNAASVCVDRFVPKHGQETALIWVCEEDSRSRIYTYKDLSIAVNQAANLLKAQDVKKGDRVGIWMPMVPELLITQLACAKIGAVAVVCFSGFSACNAEERFTDVQCKVLVTADGGRRRGKVFPLRPELSSAFLQSDFLKKVITCNNCSLAFSITTKDVPWNIGSMNEICDPEPMDSEDPLFLLYTSGSTGKPKGIVHTTGGYVVYALTTMKYVWGIQGLLFPHKEEREVWFSTADIGWIAGHSYITYAPLALGCVVLMYDGVVTYPTPERFFSLIDQYKVSHLYTSPTLLRQLASCGDTIPSKFTFDSLRVLGSVGEPILPETWQWYYEKMGKGRCPIVDTYWQTETGGYLISPIAGVTNLRPGSCCFPFLTINPKILRENGEEASTGEKGFLCIAAPWPGMMRGVYKDQNKFLTTYLEKFPGFYYTGDEAYKDADGYIWIVGRADDVIKVCGHRLGTAEIEAAISTFPGVVESAVIAVPDAIKGNDIVAFIVAKESLSPTDIKQHIHHMFGPIGVPKDIVFVPDLPKTRSGKIVRRILRNLYLGEQIGDTSALANPEIMEHLLEISRPV